MLKIELLVDTSGDDVIGTKDALLYTLEAFGEVKVVRCEAVMPTQTTLYGGKRNER